MKKFVAAFDGLKFSDATLEYSIDLAISSDAQLTGIFLEDPYYHSYSVHDLVTSEGDLNKQKKILDKKDEKTRAIAVKKFEDRCRSSRIRANIHKDRNMAINDLLKESIYADLLIIDRREKFSNSSKQLPTRFMHELLPDIQCPVLLVPADFKPIDKLILLFDGEPSSVHAIKMLSYAIPGLADTPTEVVTVRKKKEKVHVPDKKLMVEFMDRHYPQASYTVLDGLVEVEVVEYLNAIKGFPLVVLGAYCRSKVSRWFKPSLADMLMREIRLPMFIAHT